MSTPASWPPPQGQWTVALALGTSAAASTGVGLALARHGALVLLVYAVHSAVMAAYFRSVSCDIAQLSQIRDRWRCARFRVHAAHVLQSRLCLLSLFVVAEACALLLLLCADVLRRPDFLLLQGLGLLHVAACQVMTHELPWQL